MNEPNPMESLEQQLRNWTPRPASTRLARRLFGRPKPERHPQQWANWLLPAFACLVLTCAIGRKTAPCGLIAGSTMASAALSNQLLAVCMPETSQVEWNILENTFDWTNGGGTPSTIPSLFPR